MSVREHLSDPWVFYLCWKRHREIARERGFDFDPEVWRPLFKQHQRQLIEAWARRRPCCRPRAWWLFVGVDLLDNDPLRPGETQGKWLHRVGQLTWKEQAKIARRERNYGSEPVPLEVMCSA